MTTTPTTATVYQQLKGHLDELKLADAAEALAEAALEGPPVQVVELSANRTILELTGPRARTVLEKSCRADLHPRVFGVGTAIVTQLGPVPVLLHRSGQEEFRILPRSSFADFMVRWLLDGMAEFTGASGVTGAANHDRKG